MAELVRISKWDKCQPYPVGIDFGPIIDRSACSARCTGTQFASSRASTWVFVDQVGAPAAMSRSFPRGAPGAPGQGGRLRLDHRGADAIPYVTDLFYAQSAPRHERRSGIGLPTGAGKGTLGQPAGATPPASVA